MKNRFGYEWSTFSEIIPLYETQFRAWTEPISPDSWKGLRVLDAGCGTGRNSIWPIQYGASAVTAFDVDPRTVDVARQNLAKYPNATVRQHSIYELPFHDEFDLAFSIGVIHHLADPRLAVRNLVEAVKPGGRVLIWVYGKEGHTTLKNIVNSIRLVTCRIPLPILNVMTYPLSFLWWVWMQIPSNHPYIRQFRGARLWHVHSILFDQLLPEIANYWTKDEAIALFDGLDVDGISATWVNQGSWTIVARKKATTR